MLTLMLMEARLESLEKERAEQRLEERVEERRTKEESDTTTELHPLCAVAALARPLPAVQRTRNCA
jgi:hypothetical protein